MKTRIVILALFLVWVVFYVANAKSAPFASYTGDRMTITLYDEDCKLADHVTNLPKRSTWAEAGKVYEGCWSAHPGGFVIIYSTDKTIAVVPSHVFVRVNGV